MKIIEFLKVGSGGECIVNEGYNNYLQQILPYIGDLYIEVWTGVSAEC